MLVRDLLDFVAESRRGRRSLPGAPSLPACLRDFRAWRRALRGPGPLDDAAPWVTFAAARFLERTLTPCMRVFEWGSGGSTLFFRRRAASVVSIEHDPEWFARVRARLAPGPAPGSVLELIAPRPDPAAAAADPADPAACVSSAPELRGQSFAAYAARIDAFPDAHFDLVLVDGRARPACLLHALPKIAIGGWLVLDNSERPHYAPAMSRIDAAARPPPAAPAPAGRPRPRFRRTDFAGPIPYLRFFIRTTAWQRLE